jgi:putative transposase
MLMPWKETCAMDQKMQMIGDWLSKEYSITELSRLYEVSRKTIYKYIDRYNERGAAGIEEQSRAPDTHPNETPSEIVSRIVAAKMSHQKWGPKKVIAWLKKHHPSECWPAISTASEILKREGLVRHRRKRRRMPPYTEPFNSCDEPNSVWAADYKGQFRTMDQRLCYPLTITDGSSRYLLQCRALSHPSYEETQPWFEWVFLEYGLPESIRTDNGAPFASLALGGLSRLSIWFIKLGIKPERIEPGCPEQNGRHERMHRTLKESAIHPPRKNLKDQQKAFNQFVYEYNFERPHEALNQQTPESVYRPSQKSYPIRTPSVEYDTNVIVRQVRHNGEIRWNGNLLYVSETLAGEPVALKQMDEHLWKVRFSFHQLGILDELKGKITPQ